MKCSLALLATAAGAASCNAFIAVPKPQISTPSRSTPILQVSAADEAAEDQAFAPEQLSRRTFTSAAAAALSVGVAGMVTAPGYAEAYQAPLDKQVKAIESANYMVRIVGCHDGNRALSPCKAITRDNRYRLFSENFSSVCQRLGRLEYRQRQSTTTSTVTDNRSCCETNGCRASRNKNTRKDLLAKDSERNVTGPFSCLLTHCRYQNKNRKCLRSLVSRQCDVDFFRLASRACWRVLVRLPFVGGASFLIFNLLEWRAEKPLPSVCRPLSESFLASSATRAPGASSEVQPRSLVKKESLRNLRHRDKVQATITRHHP